VKTVNFVVFVVQTFVLLNSSFRGAKRMILSFICAAFTSQKVKSSQNKTAIVVELSVLI
jgi:hypothetical protein